MVLHVISVFGRTGASWIGAGTALTGDALTRGGRRTAGQGRLANRLRAATLNRARRRRRRRWDRNDDAAGSSEIFMERADGCGGHPGWR